MKSQFCNLDWKLNYKSLECQKKKIQIELSKNLKSHTLENVVTGQIFMAIENIHSKCQEINNSIKMTKNAKKTDVKVEKNQEKEKKENSQKAEETLPLNYSE